MVLLTCYKAAAATVVVRGAHSALLAAAGLVLTAQLVDMVRIALARDLCEY